MGGWAARAHRGLLLGTGAVASMVLSGCEPEGSITNITLGGDNHSWSADVSADGAFVAFTSDASNLVPGDAGGGADVFLWERSTGTTVRVTPNDSRSLAPRISDDGRYVVYLSSSPNVVPGDLNGRMDVFRWDRTTGATIRVTDWDQDSTTPQISGDGQRIAFVSTTSGIDPSDTNGRADVFVWDASNGTTIRVTNGPAGGLVPSISADGRRITYHAFASDDVPDDTNDAWDVFLWDADTGTSRRLTDGNADSTNAEISADGNHVVFRSSATDLVPDALGVGLFLWDATIGGLTRITAGGQEGASISADGSYVAFQQQGSIALDVAIWNATSGATTLLTDGNGHSRFPSISAAGRAIVFSSPAFDLVPDDDNGADDIFIWTRTN